jgi:hypothetical protein
MFLVDAAKKAGQPRSQSEAGKLTRSNMAVLDDVRAFGSRLSPGAVCDDCIAEKLDLSVRQHANQKTRELAGSEGFERRKAECSLCGANKLVTRRA